MEYVGRNREKTWVSNGSAVSPAARLLLAVACGDATRHYQGRGVVREVQPDLHQLVIEHEDIAGLMPAMTMNFDVADPKLLAQAKPGEAVDFELSFDGRSYRITRLSPRPGAPAGRDRGLRLADLTAQDEPAPDFRLIDQRGREVALTDLRGLAVVLDFVYTNCPGPCPILTSSHVTLQHSLAPALRSRTRFVSISLDPERDTPEVMRRYGTARGADLNTWSFLTGSAPQVEDVLKRYGVGRIPQPDGTIDHLVVTFLIDPAGRIVRRYVGLEHRPEEIAGDLAAVLAAPSANLGAK